MWIHFVAAYIIYSSKNAKKTNTDRDDVYLVTLVDSHRYYIYVPHSGIVIRSVVDAE